MNPSPSTDPKRLLPIPGCHNLRDLGGYRTESGQAVRWRRLLRAGHMGLSPEAEEAQLAALGVVAICDLRSTSEREHKPSLWAERDGVHYWSRDYDNSSGDLNRLLFAGDFTAEQAREAMHAVYRDLPQDQAPAYRRLFEMLLAGQVPLIFNCSAGKDRTGLAAALVLHALGVPRAVIEADFALSDLGIAHLMAQRDESSQYANMAQLPQEACLPLMCADPAYLETAFQHIDRHYGGVEGYLESALGLSPSDLNALRAAYLE